MIETQTQVRQLSHLLNSKNQKISRYGTELVKKYNPFKKSRQRFHIEEFRSLGFNAPSYSTLDEQSEMLPRDLNDFVLNESLTDMPNESYTDTFLENDMNIKKYPGRIFDIPTLDDKSAKEYKLPERINQLKSELKKSEKQSLELDQEINNLKDRIDGLINEPYKRIEEADLKKITKEILGLHTEMQTKTTNLNKTLELINKLKQEISILENQEQTLGEMVDNNPVLVESEYCAKSKEKIPTTEYVISG